MVSSGVHLARWLPPWANGHCLKCSHVSGCLRWQGHIVYCRLVSDTPPKSPPMSSTTHTLPPLFTSQSVSFFHNKSSCQVPRNLKSLGTFRGLGAFFLGFFASIDREGKSLHICGRISVKFANVQDPNFCLGACVNRRRASSRNYRLMAPVRLKLRNQELAFTENLTKATDDDLKPLLLCSIS